jgi:hypothetical protein
MPSDANVVLQALTTKTATFQPTTGLDLISGTPIRGLVARILYSAASAASGTDTVTFQIDHSSDNSTFYTLAVAAKDAVTLPTSGSASGEIFIRFFTKLRYVRLSAIFSSSAHTDTITYVGDIVPAIP